MVIMKALKDFIENNCPCLNQYYEAIGVDYLGADPTSYSIESVPVEPIVKQYVDGSTLRQLDFVFASREAYGEEVRQNIENLGFYEAFAAWLEECSIKGFFPDLGENREVRSIKALTNGYPFNTSVHDAKYQVQCRIGYYQKGKQND